MGLYWGYQVRVAHSFKEIFENSIFEEGYDLKIGDHCNKTNENNDNKEAKSNSSQGITPIEFVDFEKYRNFRHALVFFGGLQGIEGVLEGMETNEMLNVSKVRTLFDENITCTQEQGTRMVRTEE